MAHSRIHEIGGDYSLTFYCGDLPADGAVVAGGHEPNGYFWEGIATLIAPDVIDRLELDSEGGMFSASGLREDVEALQAKIEPIIASPDAVGVLIARAHAEGFQFDD